MSSLFASYDSTYVLTIKQKFAIPEDVDNNDQVGIWMKTFTWVSVGKISYSIIRNYNSAFSINSNTGLITVSDASKINGKIVQQDTVINIIIRTTDAGVGFEDDTCEIKVKENSYCKFYAFGGNNGKGTRDSPFNRLNAVGFQVGYGYFMKRGTVMYGESTNLSQHIASSKHPTLFGAYGSGKRPVFDGTGANATSQCFYFGDESNTINGRCEYVFMYDIDIKDYTWIAIEAYRTSRNMGFYNLYMHNNDVNGRQSNFVISTSSYSDTASIDPFELINCEFDTVGRLTNFEPSHLKIGTGPISIINCRIGESARAGIRFCDGSNGGIMKHCIIDTKRITSDESYFAVQVRMDHLTIEDCRIFNGNSSIYITAPGDANTYEMQPDYVTIKNCYLFHPSLNAIWLRPPGDAYNNSVGNTFEDNWIDGAKTGIVDRNGNGTVIRRNRIQNVNIGISLNDQGSGKGRNSSITCNVIFKCTGNAIKADNGIGYSVFNNTIDGIIDFTGTTGGVARNNFYKSITGISVSTNNIIITPEIATAYFQDYTKHDYRLKSTAVNAINKGYPVGLNYDYSGNSINGIPDIGAYEFASIDPGNPPAVNNSPVINDQSFVLYSQDFKDSYVGQIIAYDNDAGQILTYSIVSGNGAGIFTMDGKTGKLSTTTTDVFSSEVSNYELQVRVDDNGVQPKNSTAFVKITFMAHSNNVYINPLNTSDPMENGSYDHPYDSWQDVKWQEGNAYLQKRGTTAKEEKIFIGADNVTLGAYDEGELPAIESNVNSYVISGFDKKNITISYLNIKGINAVSCIYFLGSNTDNITIEHCNLDGNANSIRAVDGMKFIIKYNTISSENEGIYSMANSIEAYYNIFKNNSVAINVAGNSSKANIFNNVFIDNIESVSSTYAELTLYNNIFYLSAPNHIAIQQGSNKISSDHNIFFPDQKGFIEIAGKTYDDLKHIQQGLNMDLHSFNSDPLFSDLLKGDFTIKRQSPAINSGINLNLVEDLAGEKVPYANLPDIGAFEFKGVVNDNRSQTKEGKSTLLIYPNPSTGLVNVDIRFNEPATDMNGESVINPLRSELKVVNMSGKIVYSKVIESTESLLMENLDLTGVSNGLYNVVLQMANKILTKKLVINK